MPPGAALLVPEIHPPSHEKGAMWSKIERVLSVLLVLAALVMALGVVRREFFAGESSAGSFVGMTQSGFEQDWQDLLAVGIMHGDRDAPIQIIEFGDLECPACRVFELSALDEVHRKFGDSVAVTFVHFPLPQHRFARAGGVAAECAHAQGQARRFIRSVYQKQDSIGLKSWLSFGLDAGMPDSSQFVDCLASPGASARVEAGFVTARDRQLAGTPTVIVNGWRFANPPNTQELVAAVEKILRGEAPLDTLR